MNRYFILLAAILIQASIGGIYAWSVFVPSLTSDFGMSTTQTQLVFGAHIAVFTLTMVWAGRLILRISPRIISSAGGLLFGCGYLLASSNRGDFLLMLLAIGLIAGIGTGCCYVSSLTMCAAWFPGRKGLATGFVVAGFAAGSIFLSWAGVTLMASAWGVFELFKGIGLGYSALIIVFASALRLPHDMNERDSRPRDWHFLRERYFWGLCVGMSAGTFAGLLVIGNLTPLILSWGASPSLTTYAITSFALGNICGRIGGGWLVDRLQASAVWSSLGFLAMSIMASLVLPNSDMTTIVFATVIGMGFGACFVVYAALVGSRYGVKQVASIYPLLFLAYGLSGLSAPFLGGLLYDRTCSYTAGIITSLLIVVAGLFGSRILMKSTTANTTIES